MMTPTLDARTQSCRLRRRSPRRHNMLLLISTAIGVLTMMQHCTLALDYFDEITRHFSQDLSFAYGSLWTTPRSPGFLAIY